MHKCIGQKLADLLTSTACWRQAHRLCTCKVGSLVITDSGSWKMVKRTKRKQKAYIKNQIAKEWGFI